MAQVDRFDNRREHTQIKLELYRLYLAGYLSVLSRVQNVNIFDIFAGRGKDENEQKGSALIAAEAIDRANGSRRASRLRKIALKLNDADRKNTESLSENLKDYRDFISIENVSANEYIETHLRVSDNANNLFFIDPFGYSQISKDNFDKLFSISKSDFLIFIPLSAIYRFLGTNDQNARRYQPIAQFLQDMGISNHEAEQAARAEEFADIIKDAIQKRANAEYVYSHILESKGGPNKYCLYFICRHISGAKKFLEARDKHQRNSPQGYFGFTNPSIKEYIEFDKKYDNVELYKIGIQKGILPKYITPELKQMEKDGDIEVFNISGEKRKQGVFYISDTSFKKEEKRISIRLKDKHE